MLTNVVPTNTKTCSANRGGGRVSRNWLKGASKNLPRKGIENRNRRGWSRKGVWYISMNFIQMYISKQSWSPPIDQYSKCSFSLSNYLSNLWKINTLKISVSSDFLVFGNMSFLHIFKQKMQSGNRMLSEP